MILVFSGQKGGSGKTTHLVNLAVQRACKGRAVIIIDADQRQTSALKWSNRRNFAEITPTIKVVNLGVEEIFPHVKKYITEYDDIFIDTGGADSTELRLALQVADLVITPIRAAQIEVETLDLIDRRVTEAKLKNPELVSYILLNDLTTHHLIRAKAIKKVQGFCELLQNMQLMDAIIDHRQAFIDAGDLGCGVVEMQLSRSVRAAVEDEEKLEKEIWND